MTSSKSERRVVGFAHLPALLKGLRFLLALASAVMAGFMMFLTFADVMGRYFFGFPIRGAYEVTEVLMGLMIFGALPLVSAARNHITVDFLSALLPPRLRLMQTVLVDLACSFISAVLGWRVWLYGTRMAQTGETTLELKISWGLVTHTISIFLAITAIVFLLNACHVIFSRHSLPKEV
jgi:TRAP-type C4-dicarboxylate transport system permease small subunit